MPKVPEYNLPKFGAVPYTPQERIDSRYWRYKKKTPPKADYKPKRTRIKDKRLFNETYDMREHLRMIRDEV